MTIFGNKTRELQAELAEKTTENERLRTRLLIAENTQAVSREITMRLQTIEAGHGPWHIVGATVAHSGGKHLLYECACGARIAAPEGFFNVREEWPEYSRGRA